MILDRCKESGDLAREISKLRRDAVTMFANGSQSDNDLATYINEVCEILEEEAARRIDLSVYRPTRTDPLGAGASWVREGPPPPPLSPDAIRNLPKRERDRIANALAQQGIDMNEMMRQQEAPRVVDPEVRARKAAEQLEAALKEAEAAGILRDQRLKSVRSVIESGGAPLIFDEKIGRPSDMTMETRESLREIADQFTPKTAMKVDYDDIMRLVFAASPLLEEIERLDNLIMGAITVYPCHDDLHLPSLRDGYGCPDQDEMVGQGLIRDLDIQRITDLPRSLHAECDYCAAQDWQVWLREGVLPAGPPKLSGWSSAPTQAPSDLSDMRAQLAGRLARGEITTTEVQTEYRQLERQYQEYQQALKLQMQLQNTKNTLYPYRDSLYRMQVPADQIQEIVDVLAGNVPAQLVRLTGEPRRVAGGVVVVAQDAPADDKAKVELSEVYSDDAGSPRQIITTELMGTPAVEWLKENYGVELGDFEANGNWQDNEPAPLSGPQGNPVIKLTARRMSVGGRMLWVLRVTERVAKQIRQGESQRATLMSGREALALLQRTVGSTPFPPGSKWSPNDTAQHLGPRGGLITLIVATDRRDESGDYILVYENVVEPQSLPDDDLADLPF